MTCKAYTINLVQQKVRIKNVAAKSSEQINKLIKQDWANMRQTKDNKPNIQKGFSGFAKAGKVNKTRWTSYLARVRK